VVSKTDDIDGMAQVRTIGEHSHDDTLWTPKEVIHEVNVGQKRQRAKEKDASEPSKRQRDQNGASRHTSVGDVTTKADSDNMKKLPACHTAHGVTLDSDLALQLMETSPAAVMTDPVKPGNPITSVSPGFTELTGYGHDEIVGKSFEILQGSETNADNARATAEAVAQNKAGQFANLYYKKGGNAFWCLINVVPLKSDGNETFCVCQLQDVSKIGDEDAMQHGEPHGRDEEAGKRPLGADGVSTENGETNRDEAAKSEARADVEASVDTLGAVDDTKTVVDVEAAAVCEDTMTGIDVI